MGKAKEFLKRKAGIGLACLMGVLAVTPGVARADGSLDISTAYPGVSVKAGENVTVTLDIRNQSGTPFDVSLTPGTMPEGWEGYFNGGGKQISKVHVTEGEVESGVTFQLMVPEEITEGTYEVQLTGTTNTRLSDTMSLEFVVDEQEYGQGSFTCEYPEQEGISGTTFTFNTTLINNGAADQSYSLSAEAPQGWQVSFKPSGSTTQVASVEVASAASQGLSVTVIPPADVEAGEYTIPISAIAAGESLKSELKVHITGTYALDVSTPTGRLSFDAQAKETQKQTLTITNNSNVPLENINLSASAPTDWTVEFDTPTIEVLETGETKEVIASIIPGEKAMTGDYVTAITTSAAEVSDTAEFRVTVKTDTLWGLAAVAVIAGVVLGLGYVFRKYGRR